METGRFHSIVVAARLAVIVVASAAAGRSDGIAKDGVRASFPIDPADEALIVPVAIQGKSYRFILDTGCTMHVFDRALRPCLGDPIGSNKIQFAVGEGEADFYAVPSMSMGAIRLSDGGRAICRDLTWVRQVSGDEVDGFLGNPALRDLVVRLDFDGNRIEILEPSAKDRSNWGGCVPFDLDEAGRMRILANVGGNEPVSLTVDTGSDRSVTLSQSTFAALVGSRQIRLAADILFATAAKSEKVREGSLSEFSLGPYRHTGLCASSADDSCVGLPYLKRFRVTMDFPNRKMYLAKGKHFADPEEPDIRTGLHLLLKQRVAEAAVVDAGSPAERAGIRKDDRIVRIAGKAAAELRLSRIRYLLKSSNGADVPLTVQRDGKLLEVTLRLKGQKTVLH